MTVKDTNHIPTLLNELKGERDIVDIVTYEEIKRFLNTNQLTPKEWQAIKKAIDKPPTMKSLLVEFKVIIMEGYARGEIEETDKFVEEIISMMQKTKTNQKR